ncbi:hypothetical protein PLICRDRAFT_117564 [Plicaturopsis crispa FD-325 SS-3]|uniref:SET domain-containing protein n=1 Tax=Plicaturopsis crispa FD-325 SS-3 TaxID=944288 RepID=A0A0C9T5N1_PLICR|nr:hypothetical protein PLICRDRAFT_117564 [Plicaturopsis crispa FD-325 SS-3]
MSFSNLKNARQSKQSKSYVNTPSTSGASVTSTAATAPVSEGSKPEEISASGLYASLPLHIAIRATEETGRGLYAKQALKAGSVLISTKPHASALSTLYLESHCSSCAAPGTATGLKRCTRCRTVLYCNATCQNLDWSIHKHECQALQKWAAAAPSPEVAVPNDAVRCLGRICWRKRAKGSDSIWAREINAMQSHRASIPASAQQKYTHLAHSLVRYLGLSSPEEIAEFGFASPGDLVDIISRFITNSFTLTSPSLTPLGVCVSPLVALINHSCDPNAVLVFPRASNDPSTQEPLMQVVAIRDILPGEQILTAYVDTTLPRTLRQQALKEAQNFTCACTLCAHPPPVDLQEVIWCPKTCGGMCPLPTEENDLVRCTKCQAVVADTDAVLDALRVGQEALDKATSLQNSDPTHAHRLTSKMIPILTSARIVPSSHPLLGLQRLHQYLLIATLSDGCTQERLDEAIQVASKSAAGISSILAPGHPIRAIELAELGKLLAVDEPAPAQPGRPQDFPPSGPARLKMALDTLIRARAELLIAFGGVNEGGQVGREVRESIVALEKELGVWKQGIKNAIEDIPKPTKSR